MVYTNVPAANFAIKYKEFFHMKHFYKLVHDWACQHEWRNRNYNEDITKDSEFPEILYLERELSQGVKELSIWWRFYKKPFRMGGQKFLNYKLDVNFKVIALKDTQIVYNNQKYSTNNGEAEISVSAKVQVDPAGEWGKHVVLKHFEKLFKGRIMKETIEKHRILLYREAYRLHEAVKTYFEFKTFLPEVEDEKGILWPRKGIGEA